MLTPAHIRMLMVATVLAGTALWPGQPAGAVATAQSDVRVEVTANDRTVTVQDESVTKGRASADVRVETQINGQELHPLELALPPDDDQQDLSIRQRVTARGDDQPDIKTDVRLNGRRLTPEPSSLTAPTPPLNETPEGVSPDSTPTAAAPTNLVGFVWGLAQALWRILIGAVIDTG